MGKKDIEIRKIKPDEKSKMYEAARESFPLFDYIFMRLFLLVDSQFILVAVDDENVVGGVLLSSFSLKNKKVGLIDWIFVHPEAAGKGLGTRLVAAGADYFHEHDVQEFTVIVDGYNSPSWKMFNRKGFQRLSMAQQFRIWGIRTPLIWLKTFHFFYLGLFILWRGDDNSPEPPLLSRKEKALEVISVLAIISIFSGLAIGVQGIYIIWVLLAVSFNFAIYEGLEWISIRSQGFKPEFRIWEQSITYNIIIGLLGGYFPVYGNTYLEDEKFNHLIHPRIKGKSAAAAGVGGFIITMLLLLVDMLLQVEALSIMAGISLTFYFWQFIIIISPFDMFKGKRIFLWSRKIWLIFLLGFLILLLVYI